MTECADGLMRDQLPEYVHGTLPADAAARVDRHLDVCASCREEVVLLKSVRAVAARRTPVVDVASSVAALPAPPSPVPVRVLKARARWTTTRSWQYAAAAAVVLVVGTTTMWRAAPGPELVRVADSSSVRPGAAPVAGEPASAGSVIAGTNAGPEGMSFGGGLSDLSVTDLQALLVQMDSVKTLPSRDPASMTPVIEVKDGGISE